MKLAIYDTATGKVLREVSGRPKSIQATMATLEESEAGHPISADETALDRYVIDGVLCEGPPCPVAALRRLKISANQKLAESDWTILPDTPPDTDRWTAYRAKLRAAKKSSDPINEVLPLSPEEEDAQ